MAASPRPLRSDAVRNREKLLHAAREVLAERGFDAEIAEIAARAGVGTGTVYRHYPSREALIYEITEELVNGTADEVLDVADNVEDAREAVKRTMEIGFARVERYGQLVIQLVAGAAPPPYASLMDPEGLADVFRRLIRRGIEQGHFRSDLDVDYATSFWFTLVSPSAFRLLADRPSSEIAARVSDFFLAGLCAVEVRVSDA